MYKLLKKNLIREKIENIYELFEKPLIKILANMEIQGVKVDDKFLNILSKKFEKKISSIEDKIYKISKKKFNIA